MPDLEYYGVDTAAEVINNVSKAHASVSRYHFSVSDLTKNPLPTGMDLIFSRDSLQHLVLTQVWILGVDATECIHWLMEGWRGFRARKIWNLH